MAAYVNQQLRVGKRRLRRLISPPIFQHFRARKTACFGGSSGVRIHFRLGFLPTYLEKGWRKVGESKGFLGIWYSSEDIGDNGLVEQEPVWIANREAPSFNGSGTLAVDSNGSLRILSGERELVSLYSSRESVKARASLRNDGNFILHELNSDGSVKGVLWQSFDHPTDTLLPGMKLGFNTKTGFTGDTKPEATCIFHQLYWMLNCS